MEPSPNAKKILGLQEQPTPCNPPPSFPDDSDPLPFPTLCSSLKKDVLRKISAKKKLFDDAAQVSPQRARSVSVPAKVPKEGCPSKEGGSAKPNSQVSPNSCGPMTGSTMENMCLPADEKTRKSSL